MSEMTWNHRVVKRTFPKRTLGEGKKKITVPAYTQYGIHEAYYNSRHVVDAVTIEPVRIAADSLANLKEIYAWIGQALNTPTLTYSAIGKKHKRKSARKANQ